MKVVLLASLCCAALACGGPQNAKDSANSSTGNAHSVAPAPAAPASSEEQERTAAALEKLAQEQAEMFQLFQLLAGQVESLQNEVEDLRAQQVAVAARPPEAARPTRPRPDASAVYSVPITNNPTRGSKRPLVTIVESFEFA